MNKIRAFLIVFSACFLTWMVAFGQSTLKDTKTQLAAASDVIPVGTVMPYVGASAPTGWILAQGQCVSQATYPALYALTQSLPYQTGCAGGQFRLPPLNGRYLRGAGAPTDGNGGDTVALGTFGVQKTKKNGLSATFGSGSAASSGSHTHAVYQNTGNNVTGVSAIRVSGSDSLPQVRVDLSVDSAGSHSHTVTGTVTVGEGDTETRPNSYSVNYIIKY